MEQLQNGTNDIGQLTTLMRNMLETNTSGEQNQSKDKLTENPRDTLNLSQRTNTLLGSLDPTKNIMLSMSKKLLDEDSNDINTLVLAKKNRKLNTLILDK